jgi:hypothetical protein
MSSHIDNHTISRLILDQDSVKDQDSFSPADWKLILELAQQEGVGPLLYWRLSKSGEFTALPENVRNSLRAMYSGAWMQNQKIFNELEVLARLFGQAGIPVVVLKGACFALTVYPDIGLRPMGDLDLLVPKEKLAEAVQITKMIGYVDSLPEATPGLNDLLSHHIFLQKMDAQPFTLELHYSLVADRSFIYAVPVDWFWSQTELLGGSSQVRFENLLMLSPAAQILFAAAHAMLQHGGKNTPLRWYYDLDRLIRFYEERIDWELLLSQAETFEWGSALNAAFSQTCIYFNTPVPERVRIRLSERPDRHQNLVAFLKTKPDTHILEERQKLISLNWVGRFRLVMALVFPSPTYMRWRYKLTTPWALPTHYLLRWWGIGKDFFPTLVSLFRKPRPLDRQPAESARPKNGE